MYDDKGRELDVTGVSQYINISMGFIHSIPDGYCESSSIIPHIDDEERVTQRQMQCVSTGMRRHRSGREMVYRLL